MAKITLMPSGIKATIPPRTHAGGGARGVCGGWSVSAARRNDLFLRSVDFPKIDGKSFAASLTVRICPPSHADFERMRRAFVHRLRRLGMTRLHWIMEWQPRARSGEGPVPHLHAIICFPTDRIWCSFEKMYLRGQYGFASVITSHWLEIAAECGSESQGQNVKEVTNIRGWFGYLAKHGARGAFHLQRMQKTLPAGWQKTGRMWGKCGEWPTWERPIECSNDVLYALRRMMRRYGIEKARSALQQALRVPCPKTRDRKIAEAQRSLLYFQRLHRGQRGPVALGREPKSVPLDPLHRRQRDRQLERIGRVSQVSEWCSPDMVELWLYRTCELAEKVDLKTGEVVPYWVLPSRPTSFPSSLAKQLSALETVQA